MKMRICRQLLVMGIFTMFLNNVSASEVFRWTDENGQVHYGTNPPQGESKKILMRSPEAVSNDGKSEDARAQMHKRLLESYEHDRELKKKDAAKVAAEKRRKKLRCKQLSRQWENLNHYGPIYYQNKIGGREFLNEEQRQAAKDDMKKTLKKYCGEIPKL